MEPNKLVELLPEFLADLQKQLEEDFTRWQNTWQKRPKLGQELRTKARFQDYFDQFENAGIPVPWLKVGGEALICWAREKHPELSLVNNLDKVG